MSVTHTDRPCVHTMFEAYAAERPDAVALSLGPVRMTYAELDARADRLARLLRARGAGPGTLVGICLDRSFDLVVGILGILKSGAAYLPLDPHQPVRRLTSMLDDAAVPLLLTQRAHRDRLTTDADLAPDTGTTTSTGVGADREIHTVEDLRTRPAPPGAHAPLPPADADSLAYVMYTSGSTGRPKGVEITHGNVGRLFTATEHWFRFGDRDVWTLFHSPSFDLSVWEMWGALSYGGRLVIVPHQVSRSFEQFHGLVVRERVTMLTQTPTAFRQFARAEALADRPGELSLRRVVFAGEALDIPRLRPWFERHGDREPLLVNMYGITETTVHVTYREITMADTARPASVIGKPIPDMRLHLLDEDLRPVPDGEVGELYVEGPGVGRGYLNRPELTRERFLTRAGAVLYRSGDLATRLPDGDLAYAGRADDQVKIRGFRVEPGEIEGALAAHPGLRDVAVVVQDRDTAPKVVAYLIPHGERVPSLKEVRHFLAASLPDHMLPNRVVRLDRFPVTAGGKLDRRALPWPQRPPTDPERPGTREPGPVPETRRSR